jgi:hypothetical protein
MQKTNSDILNNSELQCSLQLFWKYLTHVLPTDMFKIIVILSTYNKGLYVKWLIKTFYSYIIPHHIPSSVSILWQRGHHQMQKCHLIHSMKAFKFLLKRIVHLHKYWKHTLHKEPASFTNRWISLPAQLSILYLGPLCDFNGRNSTLLLCSNICHIDCKTVKTWILKFQPL